LPSFKAREWAEANGVTVAKADVTRLKSGAREVGLATEGVNRTELCDTLYESLLNCDGVAYGLCIKEPLLGKELLLGFVNVHQFRGLRNRSSTHA
jgi:hypothetical protein